ncbi:MAG: hypothetical protein JSV03_06955 [Planctomycetota bacterium]|nr:MAG: hypothetical protein JSV03_06955 [Planctomycetota bacterium]
MSFKIVKYCMLYVSGLLTLILCVGITWGEMADSQKVLCADCHDKEDAEMAKSVHAAAGIDCRTCHGGEKIYSVERTDLESYRQAASEPENSSSNKIVTSFDHGETFQGKPLRKEIPERCGNCHSDVAKMNPYGLPTDQLAQYRLSGHGQSLFTKNNDRVAVCTDCHDTHAVLESKDPDSSVCPKNIPATCERCHSDPSIMDASNLSIRVVEEYIASVHGQGLLEEGDMGMPTCSTCHGSHSAIPPGYRDVGHVCGRCHQQEEQYFMESPHAKFPLFPRCVGCHTRSVDKRDHLISKVVASPEANKKTYLAVRRTLPDTTIDDSTFQEEFVIRREPPVQHYERYCRHCHDPSKQVGHRTWFAELDEKAMQEGKELYQLVRYAEIGYAAVATRVEEVGRGIILVQDEALMAEDLRTKLVGLGTMQHTLNLENLKKEIDEFVALADQIDQSLDKKLRHLWWRHWALIPIWAFLIIFTIALWIKYKRLKTKWVTPLPE